MDGLAVARQLREQAYVDDDTRRDGPVPHRYVHGGFVDTETKFSIYLPPAPLYEGRFLHHLEGGLGGCETTASSPAAPPWARLEFVFSCGAYLVESNQGHVGLDMGGANGDPHVHTYGASRSVAHLARLIAADEYGAPPQRGYVFGGSGGGHRAVACLENGNGIWDGAVPFLVGPHPDQWPAWSAAALATLLLDHRIPEVVDSGGPAGSGETFAHELASDQRAALATVYQFGFPRGAERTLRHTAEGSAIPMWAIFAPQLVVDHREYFERRFWSLPGYADDLARALIVDEVVTITSVERDDGTGQVTGVETDARDPRLFVGARVCVVSGTESGRTMHCFATAGDGILQCIALRDDIWGNVAPGDELRVDNRDFVAFAFWHRHQVAAMLDRYGHTDGTAATSASVISGRPAFPQEPSFPKASIHGVDLTGVFDGKMILLQNTRDGGAWPNGALYYQSLAKAHLGDCLDEHFRLWWIENAAHGLPSQLVASPDRNSFVDYSGAVQQAIRDLIAWVELGTRPAPSTSYLDVGKQCVAFAPPAGKRQGIQPVVTLTVMGSNRVVVGDEVSFALSSECPSAAGAIVAAEVDFENSEQWTALPLSSRPSARLDVRLNHRFSLAGTFFPTVRIVAHRDGDPGAVYCRVENRASVRVDVGVESAASVDDDRNG
jgi:hypothetical protein